MVAVGIGLHCIQNRQIGRVALWSGIRHWTAIVLIRMFTRMDILFLAVSKSRIKCTALSHYVTLRDSHYVSSVLVHRGHRPKVDLGNGFTQ